MRSLCRVRPPLPPHTHLLPATPYVRPVCCIHLLASQQIMHCTVPCLHRDAGQPNCGCPGHWCEGAMRYICGFMTSSPIQTERTLPPDSQHAVANGLPAASQSMYSHRLDPREELATGHAARLARSTAPFQGLLSTPRRAEHMTSRNHETCKGSIMMLMARLPMNDFFEIENAYEQVFTMLVHCPTPFFSA